MNLNIGFIGLGAMGYGMASNIRKKMPKDGVLYIFDVDLSVCHKFKEEFGGYGKVEIVDNAKEAAENSAGVVSVLPSAAIVRDTFLNETTGIIASKKNGERLLLECSTIDSSSAQSIGRQVVAAMSGVYIDGPVSGGAPGATSGTLSFMLGHPKPGPNPSTAEKCLLGMVLMMGHPQKLFWCGELGSGTTAKIVNNYLSGTILLANCEAMALGVRAGLDPKLLFEVVSNSTGQSFMFSNVNPVPGLSPDAPASRDYQGGFREPMMIKDMTLAIDAAEAVGVNPSLAKAARYVYREASEDPYCAQRDATVVYHWLSRK
ncbi:Uncharacterized protein TPAR_06266 [Tolypocladium paradoxum]|uniref:3-hydroxyisobutyrate dehydrogenase n=1 Tax=Tolypocladium paradoxum TaxID=94208 RepID=A0A2S4KTP8_9HYPO|nr:Uncharacterized protein TPAR_06266 [Tolypocladium paradoxum]